MKEKISPQPSTQVEHVEDINEVTAFVTVRTPDGGLIGYFVPSRPIFEANGKHNGNGSHHNRVEADTTKTEGEVTATDM